MSSILCSELKTGKNLRNMLICASSTNQGLLSANSYLVILQISLKLLVCSPVKDVL